MEIQEMTQFVKQQLGYLWTPPLVDRLTACLPVAERESHNLVPRMQVHEEKNLVATFKKALANNKTSKNGNANRTTTRKIGSPQVTQVALVMSMYQICLSTLTQMRMDILTGKPFALHPSPIKFAHHFL